MTAACPNHGRYTYPGLGDECPNCGESIANPPRSSMEKIIDLLLDAASSDDVVTVTIHGKET